MPSDVYAYCVYVGAVIRTIVYSTLQYEFDPNDGRWDTDLARKIWKMFPHFHPHCTLFEMFYKKLGI
jgi:hypothetical protein